MKGSFAAQAPGMMFSQGREFNLEEIRGWMAARDQFETWRLDAYLRQQHNVPAESCAKVRAALFTRLRRDGAVIEQVSARFYRLAA